MVTLFVLLTVGLFLTIDSRPKHSHFEPPRTV